MTYSTIDGAMESIQELASDSTTGGIVFNKQDLGWSNPSWVWNGVLLSRFWYPGLASFDRFGWSRIRDVVDVLAVHGVDAIVGADWINEVINVFQTH